MSGTAGGNGLNGQWAVVTGASGGIGSRIALRLAEAGANVILHAHRSLAAARQLASQIQALDCQAEVIGADLSMPTEIAELVDRCWARADRVEVWVNNAGADVLTGAAVQQSFDAKLQQLWDVDVRGTIIASRLVGKRMVEAGRGVILNMGWDQAATGMAGESGEMFAATKSAIAGFSRSLAKSLAPHVRVNCLAPGWIRTQWGLQAKGYWDRRARHESLRRRWGTPDDVAAAAVYLASPAADFINGQVLPINGGLAGYDHWAPSDDES